MKKKTNIIVAAFLLIFLGYSSFACATTIKEDSLIKYEKFNDKTVVWEHSLRWNSVHAYVEEWGSFGEDTGYSSEKEINTNRYFQDSVFVEQFGQLRNKILKCFPLDKIAQLDRAVNYKSLFRVGIKIDGMGTVSSVRLSFSEKILPLLSAEDVYVISSLVRQTAFKKPKVYNLDSAYFTVMVFNR